MLFDFVQPGGMMSHNETEHIECLVTMLLMFEPIVQAIEYVTIVRRLSLDQHLHNPQRASFDVIVQHIAHWPWFLSYRIKFIFHYCLD